MLTHSTAIQFTRDTEKRKCASNKQPGKLNNMTHPLFSRTVGKRFCAENSIVQTKSKTKGWTSPCDTFFTGLLANCGHTDEVIKLQGTDTCLCHATYCALVSRRPPSLFLLYRKKTEIIPWHYLWYVNVIQICNYWHKSQWLQSGIVSIATVQCGPEQCRRLWTQKWCAFNLSVLFFTICVPINHSIVI